MDLANKKGSHAPIHTLEYHFVHNHHDHGKTIGALYLAKRGEGTL